MEALERNQESLKVVIEETSDVNEPNKVEEEEPKTPRGKMWYYWKLELIIWNYLFLIWHLLMENIQDLTNTIMLFHWQCIFLIDIYFICWLAYHRRKSSLQLRRSTSEDNPGLPVSISYKAGDDTVEVSNLSDGSFAIDSTYEPPISDLVRTCFWRIILIYIFIIFFFLFLKKFS